MASKHQIKAERKLLKCNQWCRGFKVGGVESFNFQTYAANFRQNSNRQLQKKKL